MVCITDIMRQSILTRSEPIDGRNLMLDVSFSDVGMEQVEDMYWTGFSCRFPPNVFVILSVRGEGLMSIKYIQYISHN